MANWVANRGKDTRAVWTKGTHDRKVIPAVAEAVAQLKDQDRNPISHSLSSSHALFESNPIEGQVLTLASADSRREEVVVLPRSFNITTQVLFSTPESPTDYKDLSSHVRQELGNLPWWKRGAVLFRHFTSPLSKKIMEAQKLAQPIEAK